MVSLLTRSRDKSRHPQPKKAGSSLRPDIQGLRALAVVAVVLDHLLRWPSGGFVGVDVFFVISGFLITGLLLREHERTGSISFSKFYRRRVKRIMPAAALVIAATLVASYLTFSTSRFLTVVADSAWAFFFSANWHFALSGTDYFQADSPPSPLQHFWSLAVEEQFYFVWPWLMLLIFLAVGRRAGRGTTARVVVGITIAVVSAASFGWAMAETVNAPTVAYFSTFSRAWELGIGAFLAVIAPVLTRIPQTLRPVLGWTGLLGIVASFFLITTESVFPAPTAALPVLATALVVLAGTGGPQRYLYPLTNPVSRYLGDISYSLYLWHFPVIIITGALVEAPLALYLIAGLGSLVISIYSYHLVEDPIRRSNWLDGTRKPRDHRKPLEVSDRYRYTAVSLLAVVALCVSAAAFRTPTPPTALPIAPGAGDLVAGSKAASAPVSEAVATAQKSVQSGLNLAQWPAEITPSLDRPADGMAPEMRDNSCMNPEMAGELGACTSGDGDELAVLLGDSVAASWGPTVREALNADYQVQAITFSDCPFIDAEILVADKPAATERCNTARSEILNYLQEVRPALVVLSSFEYDVQRLATGATGEQAFQEWEAATEGIIRQATDAGSEVVVLGSNPSGESVKDCATPNSTPADCASAVAGGWFSKRQAEQAAAAAADATYVDPLLWFCSEDGLCPAVIDGKLIRWDRTHLNEPYGRAIAPLLREALKPILQ